MKQNDAFSEIRNDALTLWNFHQMGHELKVCDAGLGLGSHDLGVAEHAAHLYLSGLVPVLIFSGATSPTTKDVFPEGEAIAYRDRAIELGVPNADILVEPTASNTGENFSKSRALALSSGLAVGSLLVISKPYMQRRAYATAKKMWPEVEVICSSEALSYEDYVLEIGDEELVIDMIVGDLQRIMIYPDLGYAIVQVVPNDVENAYRRLVDAGYTSRLVG